MLVSLYAVVSSSVDCVVARVTQLGERGDRWWDGTQADYRGCGWSLDRVSRTKIMHLPSLSPALSLPHRSPALTSGALAVRQPCWRGLTWLQGVRRVQSASPSGFPEVSAGNYTAIGHCPSRHKGCCSRVLVNSCRRWLLTFSASLGSLQSRQTIFSPTSPSHFSFSRILSIAFARSVHFRTHSECCL